MFMMVAFAVDAHSVHADNRSSSMSRSALKKQPYHNIAVPRLSPWKCRLLIDHGADVNAKTGQGQTALKYASRDGFLETVKILIANRAEINSTTSFGFTALMVNFKIKTV